MDDRPVDLGPSPEKLLADAREMLRMEFVKQPLLTVFFTAESWRLPLVGALSANGYLSIPVFWNRKPWASYWPLDLPPPYEITGKAQKELNHALHPVVGGPAADGAG